jgi:hypothetical protein
MAAEGFEHDTLSRRPELANLYQCRFEPRILKWRMHASKNKLTPLAIIITTSCRSSP